MRKLGNREKKWENGRGNKATDLCEGAERIRSKTEEKY